VSQIPTRFAIPPPVLLAVVLAAGAILLGAHAHRYLAPDIGALGATAIGLPQLSRLVDALRAFCWLAAINASAWSLGAAVERFLVLPPALRSMQPVYRLALGLALVSLAVLALASLHLLHAPAFAALLGLPPAAYAIQWWRGRSDRGGHARWRNPIARPSRLTLCLSLAFSLLLVSPLLRALGGDPGWDALTYHLAFPAQYLDDNGIVLSAFSHMSGYVATTEMLYLLALAVDGESLAVLIDFEFGLLILAAVWLATRTVTLRAAMIAPLILLADPLFQLELGWAYSDLSLALYTTLAAVALSAWLRDDAGRPALLCAGVFLGLACATRYLGLNVALAFALLVWLPPRHRMLGENLRATMVLAGSALLMMLPWLIRNAVFTGNPVMPLMQSVFHEPGDEFIPPIVMAQSAAFQRYIGMGRELGDLIALPWNLVVNSTPGLYTESFGFQIGPAYVIGLVPAVLLPAARRNALAGTALGLVAILTLLWFYSFQEARFLASVYPLAAMAGAIGLDRAADLVKPWGRSVLLIPIVAAIICQLSMLETLPDDYRAALGVPVSPAPADTAVAEAAAFLRQEMAGDALLLLWLEERSFLFRGIDHLPYHIGAGSPSLAFVHEFSHGNALHCGLLERGVTHLLVNENYGRAQPGLFAEPYTPQDYTRDLRRVRDLMRHKGELLFGRDGVKVYRVAPRPCD
jgi:hypothetical protein